MKNDQKLQDLTSKTSENTENNQNTSSLTSSQEKFTLSVPNPQIYISKVKNKLKTTKFFQKTLKSQVIFVFLLVFFIINVVIAASNVKQTNKKLNEDMVSIYEMIEVLNVARKIDGRQIKYLESVLDRNNVYIDYYYASDISDEV